LRPEKNLARLIRAFAVVAAHLPDDMLRLVIVGDGPERQNLETAARASGRGKQILFVGPTTAPHLSLAEFDVFALSSDTEQMPLSVLEAMAAHLPVVSFAVGDLQNMVSEENRSFVSTPLDDEESYHRCLHTLIFSRELRERLGTANQTRVQERFEQRLMVTRYAQLFG
jgi:glycosyltransferase involved in cell wall biosynthesis